LADGQNDTEEIPRPLRALGCRLFSAENCPLDSFPGAPNLGMTFGELKIIRFAGAEKEKDHFVYDKDSE